MFLVCVYVCYSMYVTVRVCVGGVWGGGVVLELILKTIGSLEFTKK